jgi:AraC-like DNA-binding protein
MKLFAAERRSSWPSGHDSIGLDSVSAPPLVPTAEGHRDGTGGRLVSQGSGAFGHSGPKGHGQQEKLQRAKDLIDARYYEPLDVPALARAALLSCAHFSRVFRRTFGLSPHQYVIARRMERATVLLRTTDSPVKEICQTVGLRSVGSFTTRFGRTFGVSPTAYRAAHRRAAASESSRAS